MLKERYTAKPLLPFVLIALGAFGIGYSLSTETTIERHCNTIERPYRAELDNYVNHTVVGFVSDNHDTLRKKEKDAGGVSSFVVLLRSEAYNENPYDYC